MNSSLHNYYNYDYNLLPFSYTPNFISYFSTLTNAYTFYMNRHVLIHTDGTMHILPHCTVRLPGFQINVKYMSAVRMFLSK